MKRASDGGRISVAVVRQPGLSAAVDPELMPFLRPRVVEADTTAGRSLRTRPLFLQHAAAVNERDRVRTECHAGRINHVPIAQPEVELAILGRAAGARRLRISGERQPEGEQCRAQEPQHGRYQGIGGERIRPRACHKYSKYQQRDQQCPGRQA